jgi:hypothetical protein
MCYTCARNLIDFTFSGCACMIYVFVTNMQTYLHTMAVTSDHAHDVQWTTNSQLYVAAAVIVGVVVGVV